jgi:hypothetical protein
LVHDHGHFEHLLHTVDTVDVATVVSIVWFSFVMSWHCAAMCGPLACARFAQVSIKRKQLWLHVALYNIGRVISYSLMGALVAAVSENVGEYVPYAGNVLAVFFGVIVALQGFFLLTNRELTWAPRSLTLLAARASAWSNRLDGATKTFAFGFVTVALPCMTLASALAAAAMSADVVIGSFVMFGFAVGTVPVMALLPLIADNLTSSLAAKLPINMLRRMAGALLLVVSGMTILRTFHR